MLYICTLFRNDIYGIQFAYTFYVATFSGGYTADSAFEIPIWIDHYIFIDKTNASFETTEQH